MMWSVIAISMWLVAGWQLHRRHVAERALALTLAEISRLVTSKLITEQIDAKARAVEPSGNIDAPSRLRRALSEYQMIASSAMSSDWGANERALARMIQLEREIYELRKATR